jgi:4-aminobutyrate aminotransferase/(S)-3-amino-2-methylpropionate transaminase
MTEDEYSAFELKRLKEALKNQVDPKNVAAIIIELVQGEGGFNVAPKAYVKGLRQLCDETGILLIDDEVQSGFGRTGKWAAYQHYGIIPDISTWAKSLGSGMPIGAVVGKKEIMDAALPGTIGGTYLGNPVSCAAANATINYMEEIGINEKAREISKIVEESMERMKASCNKIGDVRGLGAMQAMEFVLDNNPQRPDGETATKLMKACLDRGLLLLNAGIHKNVIRILSPLTMPEDQLTKGLTIIEEELRKL